jgi:hypothetical protein
MKRVILVAAVALLLVGCGQSPSATTSPDSSSTATVQTTAAVTITSITSCSHVAYLSLPSGQPCQSLPILVLVTTTYSNGTTKRDCSGGNANETCSSNDPTSVTYTFTCINGTQRNMISGTLRFSESECITTTQ